VEWVYSGDLEKGKGWDKLQDVDGIVVPGGFGYRGIEGKVLAAKWAREEKLPYLGLCLGMQIMTIEYARNVLGWEDANSSEFDNTTTHPVIDLMPDQKALSEVGGTMRLGHYPCLLKPGTLAASAYDDVVQAVDERHRHRFEVNNTFRDELEQAGLIFSGLSPDGRLVEVAEIEGHPFMLGSQYHPEFQSRPNKPHPLFDAFISAAITHRDQHHTSKQNGGKPRSKAKEQSPAASD
jgi:CTP synthase